MTPHEHGRRKGRGRNGGGGQTTQEHKTTDKQTTQDTHEGSLYRRLPFHSDGRCCLPSISF